MFYLLAYMVILVKAPPLPGLWPWLNDAMAMNITLHSEFQGQLHENKIKCSGGATGWDYGIGAKWNCKWSTIQGLGATKVKLLCAD